MRKAILEVPEMPRIRIETAGHGPAEIEDHLRKAVQAVRLSQDTDFADPVMQRCYSDGKDLFERILDAMVEEIGALQ